MALTEKQREALNRGRAISNERRRQKAALRAAGAEEEPAAPLLHEPEPLHDTPPADKAPRSGGATAPRRPAGETPSSYTPKAGLAKIRAGLVSLFTTAGIGLSMVDAWDGQVVALNAGKLADSWTQLAEQDPRVRKALETLLAGSAWGTAITTTAMVALPIAAHHRLAPPEVGAMAAQAGIAVPDLASPATAEVRVERRPAAEDNGTAPRAASAAPAETAPTTPEEAAAAWAASGPVPPVDAGAPLFPMGAEPPAGG